MIKTEKEVSSKHKPLPSLTPIKMSNIKSPPREATILKSKVKKEEREREEDRIKRSPSFQKRVR